MGERKYRGIRLSSESAGSLLKKDSPTSICSAGVVVIPIVSWSESLLTLELRVGAAKEQSDPAEGVW